MIKLTHEQKNRVTAVYPALAPYFAQQETNELLTELSKKQGTTDQVIQGIKEAIKSSGKKIKLDVKDAEIVSIKGEKGEPGKDGYTPQRGKDYFTPKDINTIAEVILKEATPIKGVHYEDGKSVIGPAGPIGKEGRSIVGPVGPEGPRGKDGTELTAEEIAQKLNTLTEALELSVIKGIPTFESIRDYLTSKGSKGRLKGKELDMSDLRWHGGGLSTVVHDATLTGLGTSVSPLSVVGTGSFSGLQEKSTTTPNGVTQIFAFTHAPKMVFWNGALQTLTDDYTVSSLSITFTGSQTPLTGDKVINVY